MQQPYLPGIQPPTRPAENRDARLALASYPAMSTEMLCRYAKHLGHAAELLVDSVLMRLGERAYPAAEFERHDRLLLLPDGVPIRIQVKARHCRTQTGAYVFNLQQRSARGCSGKGPYQPQDFELLAMVVLAEGVVHFTAAWQNRHVVEPGEIPTLRRHPRASLDAALAQLGHISAIPGGSSDIGPNLFPGFDLAA
jgi:hypothetical protein